MFTLTTSVTTVEVPQVLDFSYGREARTIVHTPISSAVPDVTFRPLGLRTGVLSIFCPTRELAAEVETLHSTPLAVAFEDTDQPANSMVYVATGTLSVTYDVESETWTVRVSYSEVGA